MIEEAYVSFETAKLLKERGFDGECSMYYNIEEIKEMEEDGEPETPEPEEVDKESLMYDYTGIYIKAPSQAMAMRWLREVHNIDIIAPPQFDNSKWTYSAVVFKLSIPCTEIRLNDNKDKKEEAVETAIKYCLENLI